MPKILVIVESPAKAKTIEKYLGRNYKVKASVGHIRDLPKSKMGIDIEENFEPKYITIRGKGPVLKELRKEAKKVDKIYLATDPDREGEAIAWHLAIALKMDLDSDCRIVFREITKKAVKEAIKMPRKIDYNLVDAQQARRVLDRLVGYSISPLLWDKIRRGLSAGRVQSVASRIICDRENEINKFIPEEYWEIDAKVEGGNPKEKFSIHLDKKLNKKLKISSNEESIKILDDLSKNELKVKDVKTTVVRRKPYLPFKTSTLQQEASNKLGFTTRKTMAVAQGLYEGVKIAGEGTNGLITYMRTDSTRISEGAVLEARNYIENEFSKEYLGGAKKEKKKKKSIQDAHEAIRPTSAMREPLKIKDSLSSDQFKLYELIWKRFISSYMKNAEFNRLKISVSNGDYLFSATGQSLKFDGFLKVYSYVESKNVKMPIVVKDEVIKLIKYNSLKHVTKPPARYSEASLVKVMEEKNIGRPSTYAPTISTILKREYIEKEGKYFKPTELGIMINDIMVKHFSKIVDLDFTSMIEDEFDDIEEGTRHWKTIIEEFYNPFEKVMIEADKNIEKIDMTEETDEICEKCGSPMVIKYGRFGKFMACSNYPECKNTKSIVKKIGVKCPKCETGEIIQKKTKKKRIFYGCSNYPKCDFTSWTKPIQEKCPECQSLLTEKHNKKSKKIVCSNDECNYSRTEDK
ncbi:MAG: type I DNA topoisomerase [Bacillota bacterium]|nr:type I DNA topoisomerase [Bacillota bacterium]